jgi:putative salt-induced outer membrane protein YdiY
MSRRRIGLPLLFASATLTTATLTFAQTPPPGPPPEPPPAWDAQLGASFVGTGGNSDTTTVGADFSGHGRWPVWQTEVSASAVRSTDRGTRTAERYLGAFRGVRTLSSLLGLSAGERAERDRLAGMNFRSITDAGLAWALIRQQGWTLDALTSLALNHEQPVAGVGRNDPVGVLQARSKFAFGATSDTTERFTYYPDFKETSAYRAEAETTAQAAMTSRLALKIGYLWRFSNAPTLGFVKSDNTATASVVLRWQAAPGAPKP